jgi:hypothetical protein
MVYSFLYCFLFPPDKHCKRRQDPAKDQSVGEVDCTVNFCNHFCASFLLVFICNRAGFTLGVSVRDKADYD